MHICHTSKYAICSGIYNQSKVWKPDNVGSFYLEHKFWKHNQELKMCPQSLCAAGMEARIYYFIFFFSVQIKIYLRIAERSVAIMAGGESKGGKHRRRWWKWCLYAPSQRKGHVKLMVKRTHPQWAVQFFVRGYTGGPHLPFSLLSS